MSIFKDMFTYPFSHGGIPTLSALKVMIHISFPAVKLSYTEEHLFHVVFQSVY